MHYGISIISNRLEVYPLLKPVNMKSNVRTRLIKFTGYWMYKQNRLPIGCDLATDIQNKIQLPMDVIFDVGANTGQTVARFTNDYPEARIYSFEPISATYERLKKNVSHLDKVSCYHMALGEANCEMDIKVHTGKDSLLNSLKDVSMNQEGTKETIKVLTGDVFCKANDIDQIDLLKIDTEGYELEVLNGFAEMLAAGKIKSIFCEVGFDRLNNRNTFMNDVINYASKAGFQFYGVYDIFNKKLRTGSDYGSILFVRA